METEITVVGMLIGKFLSANGFNLIEDDNHFANDMCGVVITKTNIEVANNNGDVRYSKDLDMYWLIGILTFHGYLSKNYVNG